MKVDLGIIGALQNEVDGIIEKLSSAVVEKVSGIDFYVGDMYGKKIAVAKCGVGKVFAAICAEAMILNYNPSLIVNTGVAGGIKAGLSTSDIVIANRLLQHDMDTSPIGDPKGLISGINKIYFDADLRACSILLSAAEELSLKAEIGVIASGDTFVASKEKKQEIEELFSAAACEMEGGAIAHTAYVNGTPFCVIRAISDSADGEATMDYPTFMPIAAKNSSKLTLKLISNY